VNPAGIKFCGACGARFEQRCPACQSANPPANKFCNQCGAPLAAPPPAPQFASPHAYTPRHLADKILTSRSALEGERKQVTVLFCDLANSVVLAERLGPEPMHALLDRFFELALAEVHRYEGTINQFLGDGFMALFGAPVALEDHAWAAVLAALAIRRSVAEHRAEFGLPADTELQVRIGVNTGLVVVGKIGDNLRMDYTAVGDTTNLAARLQEIAEPSAILVSEATRRLVHGYVRVEAFGAVPIKGKPDPVPTYRVVGLGPRRSPLEGLGERPLSRLVGRQAELAALRDLLARAEAGRGQVVGIAGEAGVGKSRLLHEFRQGLGARRVTYLQGRCLSYGSAIPYLPLLDMLRQNCGLAEGDPPAVIVEKVRRAFQAVGMDPDEWGPFPLRLLGVREGADRFERLSPEAIKARLFETFRQITLRGSRRRPIVLEVEDLQWIDQTSEEFLVTLADSVGGARIVLLVTYRPGYRPPWIEKSYATQIALQPLGPEESLSIVQSVMQAAPLPDAVVHRILAKAEGNPFFLEELTRVVADQGERAGTADVPDTIEEVLLARIDRLAEGPKRVLQTAAVLGREVSLRLLRAIWEGLGPLDAHLRELTRLEFLYERHGADEPVYAFKHPLTREVARSSLLTSRRRALHAAAGRALEGFYAERLEEAYSGLAYHYAKSDQPDKAVEYLARFAERAAHAYAHAEAVTALAEARAHVEHLPAAERDARRLDLVLREAHSLSFLGRFEEALALLQGEGEQVERQAASGVSAAYHFWLAHTLSYLGDHKRAAENAERAFEEASRAGDEATMGKAYVVLAQEHYWAGRPLHGITRGRRAAELLERAGEPWWLGLAHWVVGINYIIIGGFDLAMEAETRALAIGEALGDPRIQSYATWSTGWIHALTGEWEAGIEACKRGLGRSPDAVNTAVAEGHLGYVYLEKGEPSEAIPLLERAVQHMTQFRFQRLLGRFTTFLGEAYGLAGRLDRARELVARGLELAREAGYAYGAGWAQHALGRIARAERRFAEAEDHLRGALDTFVAIQARFMAGRAHLALAELAQARGSAADALAHLQEAYSLFRIMRVARYVDRAEALARELGLTLSEELTNPYLAVVRRGEGELFRTLEAHMAELNVGQVIWDRRTGERRHAPQPATPERRRADRRRPASSAWDNLGFLLSP